jgi:biopolymer transport protein ExbD
MAEPRRFFDVWIIETNTVYREVPFTVVVDWVQQGRLLADDRVRPSGTAEWFPLGGVPAFAAYLPRAEPYRAEDQAEALEPVAVDFAWRPRHGEDDQDVDMIPLIDVSLVLLLFFMMTATVAGAASLINTPEAKFGHMLLNEPKMLWVGINKEGNRITYSLGQGDQGPDEGARELGEAELLQRLDERLKAARRPDVRIKAGRPVPYEVVKRMTLALEERRGKGMVARIYAEVSERQSQ